MKRSKHSLSHYKLFTGKMGLLIPISWFEALPGDTIQQSSSCLLRCAPMVAPTMHPVQVRIHHWFVPNRIIWGNWENFITGGPDGMDATVHPYSLNSGANVSSLNDYLGVPTSGLPANTKINILPQRAYSLIWNEFYRDQDLQSPLVVSTADGQDTTTNQQIQSCDWEKDYLTSSRPWEVKGPAITVPLGTQAPVRTQAAPTVTGVQNSMTMALNTGAGTGANLALGVNNGLVGQTSSTATVGTGVYPNNLFADLQGATGVSINVLRHALALQRFEEARARYGSRYTEYLRYLGVRSSDARLQRPEYLGGGRQTIQFSEVLQTAEGTNPVAMMRGHGIAAMRSNRYRRFFEEHGIVMTLLSVRPRTMYSQRLARAWSRGVARSGMQGGKEDYWQVELQHIGQQAVNSMEADASAGDGTFGYQDRYDEYRRMESSVGGLFRTTLDYWHLAREFATPPALNSTFVSCVPSTRMFADTASDNLYVMANHSIQARRLVSAVGTSLTF